MSHECDIQLEGFDLDVWVSQWVTGVNTQKNTNIISYWGSKLCESYLEHLSWVI